MLIEQLSAGLERVIGLAVIDEEFGQSLIEWPAQAVADFGLTPAEVKQISSLRARSVQELAAMLLEQHYPGESYLSKTGSKNGSKNGQSARVGGQRQFLPA